MCSLALHPTVNKQNTTQINFQYTASADCLSLQNLMQADQHGDTKCYAVTVPYILYLFTRCGHVFSSRLTVTMSGHQRQLQHGDDSKSVFGYQAHRTERKISH